MKKKIKSTSLFVLLLVGLSAMAGGCKGPEEVKDVRLITFIVDAEDRTGLGLLKGKVAAELVVTTSVRGVPDKRPLNLDLDGGTSISTINAANAYYCTGDEYSPCPRVEDIKFVSGVLRIQDGAYEAKTLETSFSDYDPSSKTQTFGLNFVFKNEETAQNNATSQDAIRAYADLSEVFGHANQKDVKERFLISPRLDKTAFTLDGNGKAVGGQSATGNNVSAQKQAI